jgi:hypothetical protein
MKKHIKIVPLILILIMAVTSGGCGVKFVNSSAATIGATASVYDIGMQTVSDLQAAGYVTDEQRVEINNVARIVKNSLLLATDALVAYNNALNEYELNKNDLNKAEIGVAKIALKSALEFVSTSWGDFARLVNSIKPDTLPESL